MRRSLPHSRVIEKPIARARQLPDIARLHDEFEK